MKSQPFFIPLFGITSGILSAEYFSSQSFLQLLFGFSILILTILLFQLKKDFVILFISFFIVGNLSIQFQSNPYKQIFDQRNNNHLIQLKTIDNYKSSEKFKKYKAKILQIDSVKINSTNALLYWPKENSQLFLYDEIWISAKITSTQKPLNPYQFDYANYLNNQKISYTVFADSHYHISKKSISFLTKIQKFKIETFTKLLKNGFSKPSASIIGAMLLGDRSEMDPEIEEIYRIAGVVHILSISGLHILIVYSFFYFMLYPLLYFKNGKKIRIVVSLILIWSYVIFVGLQPPVIRSALMISIYYFSIVLKRKPNVYHTLLLSAFLILLVNPFYLFDVGFQLSYSAVFFIVWFLPVFIKIFRPKTIFSKFIVAFIGTSIAAQIGTFPISAFYFHQTSGLFLAGNAVMILASYLMIFIGIIIVFLTTLSIKIPFITILFNGMIQRCNEYITWLSKFDQFVFNSISFREIDVFLLLTLFILLKFLILKPNFKNVSTVLILVLGFQIHQLVLNQKLLNKKEIIIFHQTKNSIIGVRNKDRLDVYVSDSLELNKLDKYLIEPYTIHEKIKKVHHFSMNEEMKGFYLKTKNIFYFNDIVIFLRGFPDQMELTKKTYLLIQNNSKLPENLLESTDLIIDGSNYPNYLEDQKYPIWRTSEKGAKIIELR